MIFNNCLVREQSFIHQERCEFIQQVEQGLRYTSPLFSTCPTGFKHLLMWALGLILTL